MWGVTGHDKIISHLENSVVNSSLAHSFLITGIDGVGKKELAVALARRLFCQSDDPPCNSCNVCRKIYDTSVRDESIRFKHPDVIYVTWMTEKDEEDSEKTYLKKNAIVIEQIRDIKAQMATAPFEGPARFFIIDHADSMTPGASNALLKILEEPPEYVHFFLLSDKPGNIIDTIVSRCQRIDLLPVPVEIIENHLFENPEYDHDKAVLAAHLSNGAPVKAERFMNDQKWWDTRNSSIAEMLSLVKLSPAARFDYAASFKGQGADKRNSIIDTLDLWLTLWRDILLINVGLSDNVINRDYFADLSGIAEYTLAKDIKNFLFAIKQSMGFIKGNANMQLTMEVLIMDMPVLSSQK
jgi:DNA polymerase-3 subunit delta'